MSVPPVRDDGTWVPGRVNARLAQVYLERDVTTYDEPGDATDTGLVARYVAVEPRSEPLDSECQQLARYGELIRARPMKACTEKVDARKASKQPRVEEVTDEEVPLQPLTSLRRAEQSTLETVAQGALWVMTLLSEAEPHPKKHKGMPIDELSSEETEQKEPAPLVREETIREKLSSEEIEQKEPVREETIREKLSSEETEQKEPAPLVREETIRKKLSSEETEQKEPVPLVREETIRKNARVLSEIRGRRGLGLIDWQELAGRISVPMSLLDLWQISPELSRQFGKLYSRVAVPWKRSRKKVSFSLEEKSAGLAGGVSRKARVKIRLSLAPGGFYTDSDPAFASAELSSVFQKKGIGLLYAPRQSHKSVGLVEVSSRILQAVLSPIEVLYRLTRRLPTGVQSFLTQVSIDCNKEFCDALTWPSEDALNGDARVFWVARVEERRSEIELKGQVEAAARRYRHEQRNSKPFAPGELVMVVSEGKPPKLRRFEVALTTDFHEDALKRFEPRSGYLQSSWDELLLGRTKLRR
ncbi:hypothetical protein E4U32_002815 [Claviceps aff. humidiphila group G2b]|nr:hypothetical protein E4U32_002815 [Claviceps aff. humidiphila group G2b]